MRAERLLLLATELFYASTRPNETVIARADHSLAADKSPITLMLSEPTRNSATSNPRPNSTAHAAIRDNQGLYRECN